MHDKNTLNINDMITLLWFVEIIKPHTEEVRVFGSIYRKDKNYKDVDCWLLTEQTDMEPFKRADNYNSIEDGLPQRTGTIKDFPDFDLLYDEEVVPRYHRIPCRYYGTYRRMTGKVPVHFHVSVINDIIHSNIIEVLKLIEESKRIYKRGDVWTEIIYNIRNL